MLHTKYLDYIGIVISDTEIGAFPCAEPENPSGVRVWMCVCVWGGGGPANIFSHQRILNVSEKLPVNHIHFT